MNTRCCASADGDFSGNAAGMAGQRLQGVFDHRIDARDMLQQYIACGGRFEAFADPFDQLQLQLIFQLSHLQADRGLGQVQTLRRRRKTAMGNDQRKCVQVIEVQPTHDKVFLMLWMTNHSFLMLW